jgi:hypothetical protein
VKVNGLFGGTSPPTFRVEELAKHETSKKRFAYAKRGLSPDYMALHP